MIDTNSFNVLGVPPYYFFAGLGLVVAFCFYIISLSSLEKNINGNTIIMFVSFIGLGLGAILFGCLTKIGIALWNHTSVVKALASGVGIVYYGGLTGFLLSFATLQKIVYKTIDIEVFNVLTVSVPLFHCFARVGCFFAGCCYGKTMNTFLSVPYVLKGAEMPAAVIPVQLIEALFELILFFILVRCMKNNSHKRILPRYLISYAVGRFILEFLRGDPARGVFGILSFSQIYSILIITGILIFRIQTRRSDENEVIQRNR